MNWRINIIILCIVLVACKRETGNSPEEQSSESISNITDIKPIIEASELVKIQKNKNIKIIDFRKPESFQKEHIKGAVNIWRKDIEDRSYPYKGIMAGSSQIETLFSDLGIKNTDTLIVYDDDALCNASRFWWVLKYYDFNNVRLLNGGLPKWKLLGNQVTTDIESNLPSDFKFSGVIDSSLYTGIQQLKTVNPKVENNFLLDTRTLEEFSGKRQKKGAKKGGRIPGSKLFDWAHAVNYTGDNTFKAKEELLNMYNSLGATKEKTIYVYCHSGVRSAHTTFVLTQLLGYEKVKNYDGSWVEWSYFEDLPIEKDSITTIHN